MKNILLLAILSFSIALYSCSESTSPGDTATVKITGEMTNKVVNVVKNGIGNASIQANEVDSIKVANIRVLMTELKMFKSSEDTNSGKMLRAGPFIYNVDASGVVVVLANGDVPAGMYDKFKLEFHRFSSSQASTYANDPIFKDFATSERNSVLIDGFIYKNNVGTPFTFKATTTANVLFKFTPAFDLTDGSTNTFAIQIDPKLIFIKGGSILDPTNSKNQNDIDNAIKSTIKILKK